LPPNLAQQQRARLKIPRALFSRACWRKIPRRARPKKQLLQRRASIQPLLEMLLGIHNVWLAKSDAMAVYGIDAKLACMLQRMWFLILTQ
jgi:hypothetical protein